MSGWVVVWSGDLANKKMKFFINLTLIGLILSLNAIAEDISKLKIKEYLDGNVSRVFRRDGGGDPFLKVKSFEIRSGVGVCLISQYKDTKSFQIDLLFEVMARTGYERAMDFDVRDRWVVIPSGENKGGVLKAGLGKVQGIVEANGLIKIDVSTVRKGDAGDVFGIWNEWRVIVPSDKLDVLIAVVSSYFEYAGEAGRLNIIVN